MMLAIILLVSAGYLHAAYAVSEPFPIQDFPVRGDKRCPPMGRFGICAFTCGSSGCGAGKICCPTACGGTSCQTPLSPPAPRPLPSPCPPGVPMAACSHLPCDKAMCPNYPFAQCVNNFCGGCNAKFYQNGREVTKTCKKMTPITPRLPLPCKNGEQIVNCFANPCDVQGCPRFPLAQCVADYCGGCNARFYINNEEVTESCRETRRRYLSRSY